MDASPQTEPMSPSILSSAQQQKPRAISTDQQRTSFSRQQRPPQHSFFDRDREQSAGGWSASSVGTGLSGPTSSANRTMSRRLASGRPSVLGGSTLRKKRDKHSLALLSIREFLKGRSCYDGLPVSFRLVVLDTKLAVKPALDVMWQAGIVSAPLWQSISQPVVSQDSALAGVEQPTDPSILAEEMASAKMSEVNSIPPYRSQATRENDIKREAVSTQLPEPTIGTAKGGATAPLPGKAGFAGMLTVNDIIHLIQYYYQHSSYDNAAQDVERFRLEMLREIEQTLHVPQPPLISIEPLRPLFEACQLLIETHARRLPLLDYDEQTGMEAVVSVLTQYRVLKFIAMNCRETAGLNRTLRSLGIGTYVTGTPGVGGAIASNAATGSARGSISSSSRRSSSAAAAASGLLSPSALSAAAPPSTLGLFGENTTTSLGNGEVLPSLDEVPLMEDSPSFASNSQFFSSRSAVGEGSIATPNRYDPIATATLDTTVFDVVHIFSEKGISAVPILDEEGDVVDMYETVDVIDLVRSGAYQSLDLTIRQALSRRSKEVPGVMTCGPDDTLATIFTLLRTQRVHRLLILEPETSDEMDPFDLAEWQQGAGGEAAGRKKEKQNDPLAGLGEVKQRRKGKLVGILCLSDVLRYVIGGKASLLDPPLSTGGGLGAMRSMSASASAIGDADMVNTAVDGETIITQDEAVQNIPSSPVSTTVEGGPRQPDLPPTIIEHPKEQAADVAAIEEEAVAAAAAPTDDTTIDAAHVNHANESL